MVRTQAPASAALITITKVHVAVSCSKSYKTPNKGTVKCFILTSTFYGSVEVLSLDTNTNDLAAIATYNRAKSRTKQTKNSD